MHRCPRPDCTAVFPRPYRLAAHILSHDNKKGFKCQYENCGREYTNNSHLIRHFNSAHKSTEKDSSFNFSCPQCWRVYSNRQNLKRHIKICHATMKSPYICDLCQKDFPKKHMLTAHMFLHTSVKGFSCECCSKYFETLREKKRHLRFHNKIHKCDDCTEQFQLWSKYLEHRKQFHMSKEFICNYCGRNFKVRSHIVHHMRLHNNYGGIFFPCPVTKCSKLYTTKSNLRQHIQSVHEDKTFDCTICEAKLSTKAKLKKHQDLHVTPAVIKKIKTNIQQQNKKKERKDKDMSKPVALTIAGINIAATCQEMSLEDNVTLPAVI